ncbi:hypothetical protein B0H15DRAFT_954502 [Mycena belliarum]|uniref:Uncharacterized protein n=1 Tax=Mycena belliarum TaxID=1033014 RepID=A0AAD6XL22_9AGAR|nr:hypothetical protein B0H15DRAFT_954502 [Mycena belliae]
MALLPWIERSAAITRGLLVFRELQLRSSATFLLDATTCTRPRAVDTAYVVFGFRSDSLLCCRRAHRLRNRPSSLASRRDALQTSGRSYLLVRARNGGQAVAAVVKSASSPTYSLSTSTSRSATVSSSGRGRAMCAGSSTAERKRRQARCRDRAMGTGAAACGAKACRVRPSCRDGVLPRFVEVYAHVHALVLVGPVLESYTYLSLRPAVTSARITCASRGVIHCCRAGDVRAGAARSPRTMCFLERAGRGMGVEYKVTEALSATPARVVLGVRALRLRSRRARVARSRCSAGHADRHIESNLDDVGERVRLREEERGERDDGEKAPLRSCGAESSDNTMPNEDSARAASRGPRSSAETSRHEELRRDRARSGAARVRVSDGLHEVHIVALGTQLATEALLAQKRSLFPPALRLHRLQFLAIRSAASRVDDESGCRCGSRRRATHAVDTGRRRYPAIVSVMTRTIEPPDFQAPDNHMSFCPRPCSTLAVPPAVSAAAPVAANHAGREGPRHDAVGVSSANNLQQP